VLVLVSQQHTEEPSHPPEQSESCEHEPLVPVVSLPLEPPLVFPVLPPLEPLPLPLPPPVVVGVLVVAASNGLELEPEDPHAAMSAMALA